MKVKLNSIDDLTNHIWLRRCIALEQFLKQHVDKIDTHYLLEYAMRPSVEIGTIHNDETVYVFPVAIVPKGVKGTIRTDFADACMDEACFTTEIFTYVKWKGTQ